MVDIYSPTPEDALSLEELELYHLIMDYRAEQGLDPIPLSKALTTTAGRHAVDTVENIWRAGMVLPDGANLHSWSDAPYYGDHRDPDVMWWAPERLGTGYTDLGFEISAAGYTDVFAALEGWKSSSGHDAVIVNDGIWADNTWNAVGIGVLTETSWDLPYGGRVYHVWFGQTADTSGPPVIEGTAGADHIVLTVFADLLNAGAGADSVAGGAGDDVLRGGDGSDTLRAGDGADTVLGGRGTDLVYLGRGHDRFEDQDQLGVRGADTVFGGAGDDMLLGRGGADGLAGDAGRDRIEGGLGADFLRGGQGVDTLLGGVGNDTLFGGGQNDVLHGGGQDDALFGHGGDDTLDGQQGNDTLTGGEGADTFRFNGTIDADRVTDYVTGTDALALDAALWGGGLAAAQVVSTYATVQAAGVRFAFGDGETFLLEGLTATAGLAGDIEIF